MIIFLLLSIIGCLFIALKWGDDMPVYDDFSGEYEPPFAETIQLGDSYEKVSLYFDDKLKIKDIHNSAPDKEIVCSHCGSVLSNGSHVCDYCKLPVNTGSKGVTMVCYIDNIYFEFVDNRLNSIRISDLS